MKKVIALVLAILMIVTVFAACSEKTCELCSKTYKGKSYEVKIPLLGEYKVCENCKDSYDGVVDGLDQLGDLLG